MLKNEKIIFIYKNQEHVLNASQSKKHFLGVIIVNLLALWGDGKASEATGPTGYADGRLLAHKIAHIPEKKQWPHRTPKHRSRPSRLMTNCFPCRSFFARRFGRHPSG
jgi:hypothetical protein